MTIGYGWLAGLAGGAVVTLATGVPGGMVSWRAITPSTVQVRLKCSPVQYARRVRFGALVGVTAGLVIAIVQTALRSAASGLVTGAAVMLALLVALGLRELIDTRADVTRAVSPGSTLRADLASGAVYGISGFGIAAALTAALALSLGLRTGLFAGLTFGLAYGVAFAMGLRTSRVSTASYSYEVARVWLALLGLLPWPLMDFLDDAYQRGVLRRDGAVYQFRHTSLQQRLVKTSAAQAARLSRRLAQLG